MGIEDLWRFVVHLVEKIHHILWLTVVECVEDAVINSQFDRKKDTSTITCGLK